MGQEPWADDKTAQLKQLWAEGRTAAYIANEVGTTRNSVCGKIHRLGLEPRVRPPSKRKPRASRTKPKLWKPKMEKPPEQPPRMVTLLELEPFHCRWPIGDPRKADFRFCGADKRDGAYCWKHARMAYVQITWRFSDEERERRRQRATGNYRKRAA